MGHGVSSLVDNWVVSPNIAGVGSVNGNSRILKFKMEVLYHIRTYFGGISPYIALT